MKKRRFVYMVFIIALLSSCKVSQNYLYKNPENSIIKPDLSNLNGRYYNYPDNIDLDSLTIQIKVSNPSLNQLLLDTYFFSNDYWGKTKPQYYGGNIEIIVLSDKKIKVSFINGEKIIKSKILKGKFINNYYSVHTNRRLLGIPYTIFTYDENKLDLGLSPQGDLMVFKSRFFWRGIFVFMGDNETEYRLTFKRL